MAFLPPTYNPPRKNDHKVAKKGKPVGPRFLVTVSVLGSAGPIRIVVTEGENVSAVITTVLRAYAREGRLPALGSSRAAATDFLLYSAGSEALSPGAIITSKGSRTFILCRRNNGPLAEPNAAAAAVEDKPLSPVTVRKGGGGIRWKSWINKSLTFKVSSH